MTNANLKDFCNLYLLRILIDLMKISDENKKAYKRNRCVKLIRNAKKAHSSNLSIKDVNDNKNF